MSLANKIIDRNKELKAKKQVWDTYWQTLADYIMPRKGMITQKRTPGEVLNDHIFDSSAINANRTMASSLIGMLWPAGTKSFKLIPAKGIEETNENKQFFEDITEAMAEAMNDPKAGLATALDEYMQDQGCFGTSGIAIFEGNKKSQTPLIYQSWNIKEMAIDEGPTGFVDTIYYTFEWPIRKVIEEYGIETVSADIRDKVANNLLDEKVKLLHAIQPREQIDLNKRNNRNKPFLSVHLEIATRHILRESGFDENPVKVARFRKGTDEIYGRSAGMDALPDILELNTIWEAITIAIDKNLDPPLFVLDDGALGGGIIDTSAGAINVLNVSGRISATNPIIPLQTVGTVQESTTLIEFLRSSIAEHFFIDKLLDFNNQTQMTLGEAQIRNRLRNAALMTLFSRQISELFTPLIERTFNIMFRRGELGVRLGSAEEEFLINLGKEPIFIPPDIEEKIDAGENIYEISYLTPAARILKSEIAEGILRTWEFAGSMAAIQPEMIDNLDADESIRILSDVVGAPTSILKAEELVAGERELRNLQLQQESQLEQMQAGAQIAKDASQAEAQVA
jgi:hypothetical protein